MGAEGGETGADLATKKVFARHPRTPGVSFPHIVMHKIWLVLLLPALLAAAPPALRMGKFALPEFDSTGAMTRRLIADSATGPLDTPALGAGTLEFFAQRAGKPEVVARLEFAEANYDRARGVIRGAGDVRFASPQGDVSGTGFYYEPNTGELRLDSKVVVKLPQGKIDAAKAVVSLNPAPDAAGNIAIKRGVLSGGVVVTELADKKLGMDRIEADQGVYTADDGLLRVPPPVAFWRGAEEGRLDGGGVELRLGPVLIPAEGIRTAPAAAPGEDAAP